MRVLNERTTHEWSAERLKIKYFFISTCLSRGIVIQSLEHPILHRLGIT